MSLLPIIGFHCPNYSQDINKRLLELTPNGDGIFGDFQFIFNNKHENHDYLVVFDNITQPIKPKCNKSRIILVTGESSSIKKYPKKYLNQFGTVVTSQNKIKHPRKILRSPGHWWFTERSFKDLEKISSVVKNKKISIISSNKSFTKGHKKRLEFCNKLVEELGSENIDFYGRGINSFDNKWDALAPYEFSIAIENCIEDHWITEKVGDCFTSLTYPIYCGAPNIDKYYNKLSFTSIDITDFQGSFEVIKNLINNPKFYDSRLPFLKESKQDYMHKHMILPMVIDEIKKLPDSCKTESSMIYPIENFENTPIKFLSALKRKIQLLN